MSYSDHIPQDGKYAVEVGANDGCFQSVTLGLEKAGWEVLCVEGNLKMEEELRRYRKNVLMVAAGPANKDAVPFYINDTSPASWTGLLPHQHITDTIYVPQRTLTWCLEQVNFPQLDVLAIDVEGAELGVLQGLDWTRWKPRTIFVENWVEDRTLANFLEPMGYEPHPKIGYDEVWTRG